MPADLRSAAESRLLSGLSPPDPQSRSRDRRVSGGCAAGASNRAPDVVRAVDLALRVLLGGLVLREARSRDDGGIARARRAAVAVGVSLCLVLQRRLHRVAVPAHRARRLVSLPARGAPGSGRLGNSRRTDP